MDPKAPQYWRKFWSFWANAKANFSLMITDFLRKCANQLKWLYLLAFAFPFTQCEIHLSRFKKSVQLHKSGAQWIAVAMTMTTWYRRRCLVQSGCVWFTAKPRFYDHLSWEATSTTKPVFANFFLMQLLAMIFLWCQITSLLGPVYTKLQWLIWNASVNTRIFSDELEFKPISGVTYLVY